MNRLAGVFWNPEQRRLRALWRLILQAAILAVLLFVFALATYPIAESPSADWILGLLASAILILAVWLGARFLDRRQLSDFGLRIDRAWALDCGFGMALGLFLMGLVVVAGLATGWFQIRINPEPTGSIVVGLLAAALEFALVSVSEELFSRGYHLRNIAEGLRGRYFGPRTAIIFATLASSIIFCGLHLPGSNAPMMAVLSLLLAGVLLATGLIFTGRLGLALGLHLTWNFAEGSLFGFAVSGYQTETTLFRTTDTGPAFWTGGDFGPEGGLLGVIAVVLGIALTLAWIRVRYGRLRIETSLAEYRRSTRD